MVARLPFLATAIALSAVSLTGAQPVRTLTFDQVSPGTLPPGFTTEALRQQTAGVWAVMRIGTNPALHHAPASSANGWSLALSDVATQANLRLTARVRLAGGSRGGGLVWHYQDPRNFMAVILDLDDGDIELFRVADGNRIRLEDRDGLDLDGQAWHSLRVSHDHGKTTVSIGGIRVLDRNERRSAPTGGRVGVVAYGGADGAFDDLRIEMPSGREGRGGRGKPGYQ